MLEKLRQENKELELRKQQEKDAQEFLENKAAIRIQKAYKKKRLADLAAVAMKIQKAYKFKKQKEDGKAILEKLKKENQELELRKQQEKDA